MDIHLCQLDCAWENRSASQQRAAGLIAKAQPREGALIVLPETFSTGFSMNTAVTCQSDAAEDETFLARIAERHGCAVMGGVVARNANGKPCNQSVTVGPDGSVLARYTKLQPFTLGGETAAHEAGSEVVVFEWGGMKIAPFICYDLRFPEHFRRAVGLGAELFVVIASWPVKRHHHWLTLLQARAIENLAFAVGVNRCGTDPQFHYNGRSIVASPHGHIVADAGESERVLSVNVDADEVRRWRSQFPALDDIRR